MATVENNENNENEVLRVRAIILSESGRILLGKDQEDQYNLIGGKINGDEHPVDAIRREIKEECGLDLNNFEMVEYLWKFHDNFVFLFVIKDTAFIKLTSTDDPDREFKGFEWFDAAGVPSKLDPYSEDILYKFLRVEIFEKDRGIIEAGHIDVIVDGKKVYELEDDVIWETLPRLAQERAKGKKVEFRQILDDGTVIDQTPNPMPVMSSLDINYIIDDLLNKYIPQQNKRPEIEITDEDSYLAKTVWDGTNTKILISEDIVSDEDVLRQVLAHEIIHHHLYTKYGKDVARHGEHFQFLADKINEIEGDNFVSKYADDTNFETTASINETIIATEKRANESFLVYRGIKDVFPEGIKPQYKGDGVFGDGEYYAFEENDALNYAIGGWGGTGEEFINFSFMLSYKITPKKPLILTDENVDRGLNDYNSDTIEFSSDELKKLLKSGSTRRSSLTGLVGFDSFILRGNSVDGGEQLILPTHSHVKPKLLEFDLILHDEEKAEIIATELDMESQELEEGYPVIYNIPANKLRQVDKLLKKQFTINQNDTITAVSSQTLTLWHGGNLEIGQDNVSHKRGRWEFGPGLYLTTHYDTAKKYSKGSRKLYQITISKGANINDVRFPIKVCLDFVEKFVTRSKKKNIIERLNARAVDGSINADTFLNIIINEESIKSTDTDELREFLVINGVDYSIQDNAFGWHERMVVLFNMEKIVNKRIITPKDKIEEFDLPTDFKNIGQNTKVESSSNNLTYYRGAPSSDNDKGDFPGVWMAKDKKTAEQYGNVWVFELDPSVRILKGSELNKTAKEFFKSLPYEHMYENEEGEEDDFELLMFPDDDFVSFLKKRGFDGYEHHSDTFLFNTSKIKSKYAWEENSVLATYRDYPYFHVSDYPEIPRLRDTPYIGGDPHGVYLGIKGKKYTTKSFPWDQKDFYWDAKLKDGVKLFDMADWTADTFFKFLKAGSINTCDIISFMKKNPWDWNLDGIKDAQDENRWLQSFVLKYPSTSFQLIKDYISKGNDLSLLFKNAGYDGILDESGDHIYDIEAEPQLVIFDPNKIIFGKRQDITPEILNTIISTLKINTYFSNTNKNSFHADLSSNIPKNLYHGTVQKFDELKLNEYGIIWLTDDPIAAKRYAKDNLNGTKTPKNLFTVEIKPKKVVDFRNVKDPIVLEYKKQQQMDMGRGVDYVIPDEEWPKYAGYHLLEKYGVDILLEEKVDVAIVLDASGAYDHISYAVLNPNIIKIIKRDQVTAGISDVLYHYTSIENTLSVLKNNQFKLTVALNSDDTLKPQQKFYYLSTTRSKIGSYHIGSAGYFGVLLKLNGRKLHQNYTGTPVDYWGPDFRKAAPSKNEMEDRVWSDKPFIESATKYIDEIHVYFGGASRDASEYDRKKLASLVSLADKKQIPLYVYTSRKAAELLDKRHATPVEELDLLSVPTDDSEEQNRKPIYDVSDWLELYEKNNVDELSTEPFGGAKGKLKTLTSFDGMESFLADMHNSKKGTPSLYKIVQVLNYKKWNLKDFYKHLQNKWHEIQKVTSATNDDGDFKPISHGFTIESKDLIWLSELQPIHAVHDKTYIKLLAKSIKNEGWVGPAILYSEQYDQIITGNHRRQAAKLLLKEGFNTEVLAINVDKYIDEYLDFFEESIRSLPYDMLNMIFGGTDLEDEVKKNKNEW